MSNDAFRRLWVSLGLNTAEFQENWHEAKNIAKEAMHELVTSSVVDGELIAEGIKEGAEAIKELAEEAIHTAAEMEDLSQKYGVGVEVLSAYRYEAAMSGTSIEGVASGLKHLSNSMVEAQSGQGKSAEAFRALGVSIYDANGHLRNSNDVMRDVSQSMSEFEDGATKTAIATAIFGKSGDELIPMLNEGKEGMDAMADRAKELGIVIDEKTAKAAKKFEDDLTDTKFAMQGVAQRAMSDLVPGLDAVGAALTGGQSKTEAMTAAAHGLEAVVKVLATAFIVGKTVVVAFGDAIGAVAAAAVAAAHGDFKAAADILSDKTSMENAADSLSYIGDLWNNVGKAAEGAAEAQEKAKKAAPHFDPSEKKQRETKEKGPNWDEEINKTIAAAAKEEEELNKIHDTAMRNVAELQRSVMTKRQVEESDYQLHIQQLQQAALIEPEIAAQKNDLLEKLEEQHARNMAKIAQEEAEEKVRNIRFSTNFAIGALDQIGKHSKVASAAARALSKAAALAKIAHDTPAAAMAAAQAVAGIPVIGPALATAASVSMYALGGAAAASVMSEGGSMGGGGSSNFSVAASNASNVTPISQQPQNQAQPTTILKIPEDAILTGRSILNLLNDALGDGSRLTNLQVIPA